METGTRTRKAPMRSVVFSFNPRNKNALQFIELARRMDFFTVEESPYDPAFVAKIRKAEKSQKHVVDLNSIWN